MDEDDDDAAGCDCDAELKELVPPPLLAPEDDPLLDSSGIDGLLRTIEEETVDENRIRH